MNRLKLLVISFICLVAGQSCLSQNSGFLGQKFNLQIELSPNLGVGLNLYESDNSDISEYMLLGGKSGYSRINLISSFDISASYVVSRKGALGFEYDKTTTFGEVIDFSGISEYHSVPFSTRLFMLKYDSYNALAPVKRYFRIGLGVLNFSYSTMVPDELDFVKSRLRNFNETKPAALIGIGGNEFLTNRIYINYGMDVLLTSALLANRGGQSFGVINFNPYKRVWSNLIEFNLGIGISI